MDRHPHQLQHPRSADAINADRRLEREIIAENDAALAPRLTCLADIHALARTVRNAITVLETNHRQHAEPADIFGALLQIDVDPQAEDERIAVYFHDVDEVLRLGALLTQHFPRMASSIIEQAKWSLGEKVVFWAPVVRAGEAA